MLVSAPILCLSPEVDVAAGIVIVALGVDAVRHTSHRRYLLLACVPLLLGVHQLIEAVAWWGLQGRLDAATGETAVAWYLGLAFVVVPLLVPLSVRGVEPDPARRRWMVPSLVAGGVAASILAQALATGPVRAVIGGRYLAYSVDLAFGGFVVVLYVAATCLPLLLSTHRKLASFGLANLVAAAGLSWLLGAGLISLWCAWAAVGSLVIVAQIRTQAGAEPSASRHRRPPHSMPVR